MPGEHAKYDVLQGANLNLNFPSVIGTLQSGGRELEYGYSSGIYLKHTTSSLIRSVPEQAEIDKLGGGKTIADWARRFDLAFEKARSEDITFVGGVAPTAVSFGRYLHRTHKVYPKDLWQVRVMTLGSVAGINTKYVRLRCGPCMARWISLRSMGLPRACLDNSGTIAGPGCPITTSFFFEVEVRGKIKMLHEMRPGEVGSLVVSTPIFPRYKIGDLIRAFAPPYFRCIGRDRWTSRLRYWWDALVMWDFDRL